MLEMGFKIFENYDDFKFILKIPMKIYFDINFQAHIWIVQCIYIKGTRMTARKSKLSFRFQKVLLKIYFYLFQI